MNLGQDYQQANVGQQNLLGHNTVTQRYYAITQYGQIQLNQPLYSGGRLTAQINEAQADILMARQDLRNTELRTFHSVIEAYTGVLRDQRVVIISSHAVIILTEELEAMQGKFAAGAATLGDRALVLARLASAQIQLINAEGQFQTSQTLYTEAVGHPPEGFERETYDSESYGYPPDLAAIPPSLGGALKMGERNSPPLLTAVYADAAARAKVLKARAALRPQVSDKFRVGASRSTAMPCCSHCCSSPCSWRRVSQASIRSQTESRLLS